MATNPLDSSGLRAIDECLSAGELDDAQRLLSNVSAAADAEYATTYLATRLLYLRERLDPASVVQRLRELLQNVEHFPEAASLLSVAEAGVPGRMSLSAMKPVRSELSSSNPPGAGQPANALSSPPLGSNNSAGPAELAPTPSAPLAAAPSVPPTSIPPDPSDPGARRIQVDTRTSSSPVTSIPPRHSPPPTAHWASGRAKPEGRYAMQETPSGSDVRIPPRSSNPMAAPSKSPIPARMPEIPRAPTVPNVEPPMPFTDPAVSYQGLPSAAERSLGLSNPPTPRQQVAEGAGRYALSDPPSAEVVSVPPPSTRDDDPTPVAPQFAMTKAGGSSRKSLGAFRVPRPGNLTLSVGANSANPDAQEPVTLADAKTAAEATWPEVERAVFEGQQGAALRYLEREAFAALHQASTAQFDGSPPSSGARSSSPQHDNLRHDNPRYKAPPNGGSQDNRQHALLTPQNGPTQTSHSTVENLAHEAASLLTEARITHHFAPFDLSLHSLARLDIALTVTLGFDPIVETSPATHALVKLLGAYIGETLRISHRGWWSGETSDPDSLRVHADNHIWYPCRVIAQRLQGGGRQSLAERLEPGIARPGTAPWLIQHPSSTRPPLLFAELPTADRLPEVAAAVCHSVFAAACRLRSGIALDRTPVSLPALDSLVDVLVRCASLPSGKEPWLQRLGLILGAYTGEVHRRQLGGQWRVRAGAPLAERYVLVDSSGRELCPGGDLVARAASGEPSNLRELVSR